jgi:hypothetical protein
MQLEDFFRYRLLLLYKYMLLHHMIALNARAIFASNDESSFPGFHEFHFHHHHFLSCYKNMTANPSSPLPLHN